MISVATIADITRRGRGTSHAWRVEASPERVTDSWQTHHLYHYGTRMLSWRIARHAGSDYGYTELVDYSLGWGSVSDQNGMNTAFRVLDLPYRFDRDARGGGPRVTELRVHACGHHTDESVEVCWCEERRQREAAALV